MYLIDWSVDSLISELVDCLIDWLVCLLIYWLIECLADWSVDGYTEYPVGWDVDWLLDWLIHRPIDRLIEQSTGWLVCKFILFTVPCIMWPLGDLIPLRLPPSPPPPPHTLRGGTWSCLLLIVHGSTEPNESLKNINAMHINLHIS